MGLLDKIGVVGIVPLAEDLFGKIVRFLADEYEHFFRARVDEFQWLLLPLKGLHRMALSYTTLILGGRCAIQ